MKKILVCYTTALLLLITGCSNSVNYTQKETPLVLEVNQSKADADKQMLEGILKNDETLKEEDKESLTLVYDGEKLKSLNTFEVVVHNIENAEILKIKVETKDTTKPIIELSEKEVEFGTDIKKLVKVSDNYDDEETVSKTLKIDGYNAETSGKQEITIQVEDSSKNQAELKIEVIVKEEEQTEDTSTQNSTYQGNTNSYTANSGSSSSGGNGSSSNSGGPSGGRYYDANGNEITAEEYYKMIEESTKPAVPNYACPSVPHHMEGNVEVWEGDPDLPCDYIFAGHVGNGGLFNTYDEAFNALISVGGNAQDNPIGTVRYNDGTVKYSFDY